jgi:hypothetical protein
MSGGYRLAILSDVHYAGPQERAAGDDYEHRVIANPPLRWLLRFYRRYLWLRHPLQQNGQLDRFLATVPPVDLVVANGDYTCNVSAFGVSDPAAFESVQECLGKLRGQFGDRLRVIFGDHELGKLRLSGTRGGLRWKSWERGCHELGIPPLWRVELGRYVLLGCTSTLITLPLATGDLQPEEKPAWERLRAEHLAALRVEFTALQPEQRVLLFCHDPSALPFLWADEVIRARLPQVERTIVGHLHSNLFLRTSRLLAGLPTIRCLGHSVERMSAAVGQARSWQPFRVLLCPSLAGIELLNDGGYLTATLDDAAPVAFQFHPLPRPRWQ